MPSLRSLRARKASDFTISDFTQWRTYSLFLFRVPECLVKGIIIWLSYHFYSISIKSPFLAEPKSNTIGLSDFVVIISFLTSTESLKITKYITYLLTAKNMNILIKHHTLATYQITNTYESTSKKWTFFWTKKLIVFFTFVCVL